MPVELDFNERRVLGVLIEKGFTTPEQYPLSLNSVVVGSNQKSCRDPMAFLDEEKALDSLESLQKKGYSTCVRTVGSRVDRWKHRFGESLTLESKEVAILAELFLRGPQTEGELRQRASRMRPIETMEELEKLIDGLLGRPDPLLVRLGPPGRARGVKYAHCFYPANERPVDDCSSEAGDYTPVAPSPPAPRPQSTFSSPESSGQAWQAATLPAQSARGSSGDDVDELRREIQSLKDRVTELEATFVKFLR